MRLFATFVENKCNFFKFLVQQKLAQVITFLIRKVIHVMYIQYS